MLNWAGGRDVLAKKEKTDLSWEEFTLIWPPEWRGNINSHDACHALLPTPPRTYHLWWRFLCKIPTFVLCNNTNIDLYWSKCNMKCPCPASNVCECACVNIYVYGLVALPDFTLICIKSASRWMHAVWGVFGSFLKTHPNNHPLLCL